MNLNNTALNETAAKVRDRLAYWIDEPVSEACPDDASALLLTLWRVTHDLYHAVRVDENADPRLVKALETAKDAIGDAGIIYDDNGE